MITAEQPIDLRARMNTRVVVNHIVTGAMIGAVVAIAVPLVLVLWSVIARGASAAFSEFPRFFTADIPNMDTQPGPGMGPAIVGTLLVTAGAAMLAIPLGVLGAVYLHEYGKQSRFARLVRFLAIVMTGVPSIVMGLFVYIVWTMRFGYSAFGGSIAMACLMLPVVIKATEQMLELVPAHLREASYALGATKSRTIVTVVLPAALPGIVSGALLAVARAAGETAPLLFTIGAATETNGWLFSGANNALSAQIFANATSSFPAAQDRAWGAALTLVLLTFAITLAARMLTARLAKR
jgi:phosphate transport system permease protein